ncbi:MAG: glycosyltransferase family 4 protein [Bacteroidia bacterium]|nr:glycosyltransferase family 4 protein [Bacteroidia bacterium]
MNICYICNEYPEGSHGGVGTMTQLLAEELVFGNNSVKIIGVYDLGYPSAKYEVKNGVEVTRIKVNFKNKIAVIWGNWVMARKIRKWITKDLVDIIECPDSYGLLSLFAPFKKPLVIRANGNNTYFSSILKTPLKKNTAFYERNLYKKASGYCAVSVFTANKMRLLFNVEDSITVIYNAVEIQKGELNLSDKYDEILKLANPIIFSGTLTPKKGIYELVKAVLILLRKGVEVTLIINGKDTVNMKTGKSVKRELMGLIPHDFIKNFIFNGHVARHDLFCQYKYAKAAIYPSFAEAFALAPMEAMASGIPTIFSKECSGEELITDKVDGLLINPSSEESIAQSIEYLLQDQKRATQIGQKGKEKIEHYFSKETMTTKTLAFYGQILSTFH